MEKDISWVAFIRQLMEMVGKERPDLVDGDTLVISDTSSIDGYNWLLHKWLVVGKPLGYDMPVDTAKKYLLKAVEHKFISFREIKSKDTEGNDVVVFGVHINE